MTDNVVYMITGKIEEDIYCTDNCMPAIKAIDYIKGLPRGWLPRGLKGNPSNTEIYNWLESGSVLINGNKPKPNDYIEYPIEELIFFPKGKRRKSIVERG